MSTTGYVLDTDTLIYFLKNQPQVVKQISKHSPTSLFTTRINATELLYGAHNSANPERNLQIHQSLLEELSILEFDAQASSIFAQEKARLRQQGQTLADMDLLIASICIAGSKILVTNNTKHFQRVSGLELENWSNS